MQKPVVRVLQLFLLFGTTLSVTLKVLCDNSHPCARSTIHCCSQRKPSAKYSLHSAQRVDAQTCECTVECLTAMSCANVTVVIDSYLFVESQVNIQCNHSQFACPRLTVYQNAFNRTSHVPKADDVFDVATDDTNVKPMTVGFRNKADKSENAIGRSENNQQANGPLSDEYYAMDEAYDGFGASLKLDCGNDDSCGGLTVVGDAFKHLSLSCNGQRACVGATLHVNKTKLITSFKCVGDHSCHNLTFWSPEQSYLYCTGHYACAGFRHMSLFGVDNPHTSSFMGCDSLDTSVCKGAHGFCNPGFRNHCEFRYSFNETAQTGKWFCQGICGWY